MHDAIGSSLARHPPIRKEHVGQAFTWLIATCVGALLPLYGTFILLTLFKVKSSAMDYAGNGELALYAGSFISPIYYQLFREYPRLRYTRTIGLIGITILLASALLYAGVMVASKTTPKIEFNQSFMVSLTLVFFLLSMLLAFVVTLFDVAHTGYDPRKLAAEDVDDLAADLQKLRGS